MSSVMGNSPILEPRNEQRARSLFQSLRESLARAAEAPLEMSHTEQAIRLAETLRAQLLGRRRTP